MKFGKILKHYERVMSTYPFVDYKRLKQLIREDVLLTSAPCVNEELTGPVDSFSKSEDMFYRKLMEEVEKCNTFFLEREIALQAAFEESSGRVGDRGSDFVEEVRLLRKYSVSSSQNKRRNGRLRL